MLVELGNDVLKVTITSLGAELKSLIGADGTEFMWQGSEDSWDSTSPLLFPIVGRLKDGYYNYNDKQYELPTHGFARSEEFDIVEQSPTEVLFRLEANEDTREIYPFEFCFEIRYSLSGSTLNLDVAVKNCDNNTMPFCFGLHPGFAHSWCENDMMDNYRIEFSEAETAENVKVEGGLLSTESVPFLNSESVINLCDDHFAVDAIVLKDIKSESVTLSHKMSSKKLTMDINDFPDFALWSIPGAGYICLEPWQGHGDRTNHNHDIWKKEGVVSLEPKCSKSFHSSITIN